MNDDREAIPSPRPEPASGFGAATYGDSFADVYDSWYPHVSDAAATARFIDRFGAHQSVLELGTGTGRLARSIGASGHRVVGIDASTDMLERFAGDGAPPVAADMVAMPFATGGFDTVLVATNTLFNLADRTLQAACFAESERVLRAGGRLVIEADVPAPADPSQDRLVSTRSIDIDRVVLTATIRDEATQVVTGQHIDITEAGIRLRPWKIRFVEPVELDELASNAGLTLVDRFEDWTETPFTDGSHHHVSVYEAGSRP